VIAEELDRREKRAELQAEMQRLMAEVHLFDLARVPPAGTEAPVGERLPNTLNGRAGSPATADPALEADRDVEPSPVAPRGDRGVDLPGVDVDGNERRPLDATPRLRRLREELLRRAAALERRAAQVRATLREP
jgi:hypothetical protein